MEPPKAPGEYIREELEKRDWTQADLAFVLNRPLPTINQILNGKHAILPEMAMALAQAFGTSPETWMQREAAHRLAQAKPLTPDVERRSRMYDLVPVKDLVKRGWLSDSKDIEHLSREVCTFLEIPTLNHEPSVNAVMRMTESHNVALSPAQRAWCCRVRQLAEQLPSIEFDPIRLDECFESLRRLAAFPQEATKVSETLHQFGIRFVVVEDLPGTKIDGTTMWIGDFPVIGMTLRFDRNDNFWFTLFHELSHVRHRDDFSIDVDLGTVDSVQLHVKPAFERRADKEAADSLIPEAELESFIRRCGPLYSKDDIVRFANRIKIHPGIIVGQLHARDMPYRSHRSFLVPVRKFVIGTAVVDGYDRLEK